MTQSEIESLVTALSLWTAIDSSLDQLPDSKREQWRPVQAKAGEQFQELLEKALLNGTDACVLLNEIMTSLGVAELFQQASASWVEHEFRDHQNHTKT